MRNTDPRILRAAGVEFFAGQQDWKYEDLRWRIRTADHRFTYRRDPPRNVLRAHLATCSQ